VSIHESPDFEANWWPIQLETVPGSGERLTIAIVVRSREGQASVRQAIDPATLAQMFGTDGKGMQFIVGNTVLSLRKQLDNMVAVEQLDFPFGDIFLGPKRDCITRDTNEAFALALRMSSGFALSAFGMSEERANPNKEVQQAFEEWSDKIRTEVMVAQSMDTWNSAFNVSLMLKGTKKARFGFVRGGYIAHFGVLRAGRTAAADLRALKLKLFDLEVVRRDMPMQFTSAELVVGYSDPGDTFPHRQRDTFLASWEHLMHEARERKVGLMRCASAHDAADHLLKIAA
jgi:hypothetical protein